MPRLRMKYFAGSKYGAAKEGVFDLFWLEDSNASDNASSSGDDNSQVLKPADAVMMLPSGGGSSSTGVKNQVQLLRVLNDQSIYTTQGFETDGQKKVGSGICSSGSTTTLLDGTRILCTLIDDRCLVTSVLVNPSYSKPDKSAPSSSSKVKSDKRPLPSSGLAFTHLADFRADFSMTDARVHSCCFATVSTPAYTSDVLVTGGNDGCIRVWGVRKMQKEDGSGSTFGFPLLGELKGHSLSVLRVGAHPTHNWLVSASEDGSFALWDLSAIQFQTQTPPQTQEGNMETTTTSNLDGGDTKEKQLRTLAMKATEHQPVLLIPCALPVKGGKKHKCVDAAFAQGVDSPPPLDKAQGSMSFFVYTLYSALEGAAKLSKWRVSASFPTADKGEGNKCGSVIMAAAAETTMDISTVPAKRMAVSPTGLFLACGDSDGCVQVVNALTMRKYGKYQCHNFPVTGLAFAPESVAEMMDVPAVLNSASADTRVSIIPLGGPSKGMETFGTIIMTLIVLLLSLLTIALLAGFFLPPINIA